MSKEQHENHVCNNPAIPEIWKMHELWNERPTHQKYDHYTLLPAIPSMFCNIPSKK